MMNERRFDQIDLVADIDGVTGLTEWACVNEVNLVSNVSPRSCYARVV